MNEARISALSDSWNCQMSSWHVISPPNCSDQWLDISPNPTPPFQSKTGQWTAIGKDGIPGFPAEENPWPIFLLAIYLALCLRIIQRKRRKIVESFVFALCSSPASKQTQTRHERKKGKNKSFCRSFTDSSRRKILSIRWCSEGGEVATLVTPGDLFHLLLKRRPVMARWSTALNFGRFRSNSELARVKDCTQTSKVRPIKVLFFYPTFQRLINSKSHRGDLVSTEFSLQFRDIYFISKTKVIDRKKLKEEWNGSAPRSSDPAGIYEPTVTLVINSTTSQAGKDNEMASINQIFSSTWHGSTS